MSDRETLDAIAKIVATHRLGAERLGIPVSPAVAEIGRLIEERNAVRDGQAQDCAYWVDTVRSAAEQADTLGGDFGKRLQLLLRQGASFVEHGSDLGGGIMPYRFKSLASATVAHVQQDEVRRDVATNAAAVAREAGDSLFRHGEAAAARHCWKAEDALRAAFGLPDPDATPASALQEKE